MNSIDTLQANFQQLSNLLQYIATEPFDIAQKITEANIEIQATGLTNEPGKGEQIDVTI